jgi:hypothetical protein
VALLVVRRSTPTLDRTMGSRFRQASVAALLWLVACSLAGIGLAVVSGQHGSIVFALFGVATGVCGALSNGALLLFPSFQTMSQLYRVAAVWVGTMAAFAVVAALFSWSASVLGFGMLSVGVPAFGMAYFVNYLLGERHAV